MLRFGAAGLTLFFLAVATAAAAPPTVTITSPPDLRGLRGQMVVSYTISPSGDFAELYYDYGTASPNTFRDANFSGAITSGSFQVATDALNEGYLALRVRSAIVNEFANSPHVVVVIDRSNPTIALGVNDTDALKGSVNIPINVTDAPINRPDVLVDRANLYVDGVLATTIPQSALATGFTLDTSQYPDGNHVLRADAVDEAGNTGVSTTKTVSFDNSPPTVTFNGSTPAEGQEVRGGALKFTFALNDAHFPLNVQCRLGDAAFGACTSVNSTNGSHDVNVTTPGSYRLEVRAVDSLGNEATAARNFRVDGGPPVTTITSGPANGASINVRDVTFAFTVDDPTATTACRLTGPGGGADFGPCSGPGLAHTATGLANGDYLFEVRSTDALGNVETAVGRAFKVAVSGPTTGATAIRSQVRNEWTVRDRFTRVALLEVRKVPAGAKVTVICRGRGCPFKRKTFRVRNRRAVLTRAFKKAKLRPNAVVEIRITAPNRIGKVVRYRIATKQVPRSTVLCLPVGASKPTAC